MWFSLLYQFFLIMRISKTGEGGYANIILPVVFVIHVSVVIVGAFLTAIMLHKICFLVLGGLSVAVGCILVLHSASIARIFFLREISSEGIVPEICIFIIEMFLIIMTARDDTPIDKQ